MSEMTAKEYAKQYKRMCKTNIRKCTNCPLYNIELPCEDSDCRFALYESSDKAIELVSKWAEEHPERTYKQDFMEKFPKVITRNDGRPRFCRKSICNGVDKCDKNVMCSKCWDEVMPEVQE